MGALKNLAIAEADASSFENYVRIREAESREADVERLVRAARAVVTASDLTTLIQSRWPLEAALSAFPAEAAALPPRPSTTAPAGGQWATETEYREYLEATTLSAAEWRRWASVRAARKDTN